MGNDREVIVFESRGPVPVACFAIGLFPLFVSLVGVLQRLPGPLVPGRIILFPMAFGRH